MPHQLRQTKRRERRCQAAHSQENLKDRSHSPDTFIGHYSYRGPTKHRARSSLPATSDPRPRSSRQSIPIGHALGNGLVQPIFRPASQRSPLVGFPSLSRRDAGLKMLCAMNARPYINKRLCSNATVPFGTGRISENGDGRGIRTERSGDCKEPT